MPYLYPQATGIIHAIREKGIDVAIASRSPAPAIAESLLEKLGLESFFAAQVNYFFVERESQTVDREEM